MLYLTFDSITTFLLPYFLGIVYLAIACWVSSELSTPEIVTIAPIVRPEEVFKVLEAASFSSIDNLVIPIKPTVSRRSRKSPVVISTPVVEIAPAKESRSLRSAVCLGRGCANDGRNLSHHPKKLLDLSPRSNNRIFSVLAV